MKKIALATLAIAFMAMPAQAQNIEEECGVSHVILPGGGCLDLSYLSVLGSSRENLESINQIYREQFEANLQLETLYATYPEYVSETEDERQARYESLAETSSFRNDVAAETQSIEDLLYPLHHQSMYIFREAFSD